MSQPPLVVLFDPDSLSTDDQEAAIRSGGFRTWRVDDPTAVRSLIHTDRPAAVVVVEGRAGLQDDPFLREEARGLGIPVVGLLDLAGDALPDRARTYDGWVHHACHSSELTARLELLVQQSPLTDTLSHQSIPIDIRLLSMIIHDIRNPLNVIGLTLRVIEQMPAQQRLALQDDITFLRENAGQIEKILSLLGDLCRLDDLGPVVAVEVDPSQFVREILDERAHKTHDKGFPASFTATADVPSRVEVDPLRARLALLCALTNASNATTGPLAVRLSGSDHRCLIAVDVERPPPATVVPGEIDPFRFERVLGTSADRRGLDLAIAVQVSSQFGGSVRVEVEPGQKSSIVLDWPIHAG